MYTGGRAAASVKVLPSAWALNSRLWQLAAARAHREDSARARKKPSGASVKVLPSAWALNSRLWQLAAARAHREDSARARKKPSGASVKVLPAFFKKLAGCGAQFAGGKRPAPTEPAGETRALRPCPYRRAAHEKKLGKQRSVFPGRRRTEKAASGSWAASQRLTLSALPWRALSPAGSGDAAQWAASITDRRGSGDRALNGAHGAPAPPKGGGETWLCASFWQRTYLAPPSGAATSRWDVAQRPTEAAAETLARRSRD